MRSHQYKGHLVASVDNGDGTFAYSIDGKTYATRQKSAVRARQLAGVRIDSKGFMDDDNTESDS